MKIVSKPIWTSAARMGIGESPIWDEDRRTLYWVDVTAPAIHALHDGQVRKIPLQKPVGSIFLGRPGTLLVALRHGLRRLDLQTGELATLEVPCPMGSDERFNDGRCDRDGRLWISTMDRQLNRPLGSVVCIEDSRSRSWFSTQARVGNGIAFSHDDRKLYFSDTSGRAIYEYDKAQALSASGSLPRKLFAELDSTPGRPDGCTIDAEGCLWSARVAGGRIDRYAPDGRLVDWFELPVSHPTHCTFGGDQFRTLFVTTANHSAEGHEGPLNGCTLAYELGIQGRAEHRCLSH